MGVGSGGKLLLQRAVVLLLGLVLTVLAGDLLYTRAPYNYQATARMLLVLPPEARREIGSPFLDLPNGLVILSTVVAEAPYSSAWRRDMADLGLVSQYEIGLDPTTATISVSVEGRDPENVVATRDWLVSGLQAELLKVQQDAGAPERQTARAHLFSAHDVADLVAGDRTRGAVALVASGVLLSVLVASVVGRSPRRDRRSVTGVRG